MSNTIKTAVLLGAMSAVLLFLGEALGGAQGLVIGFLFAVVTNFVSYWFSDKIVLGMYRATQVGPEHRLYRVVAPPRGARRPAHAEGLRDSSAVAQRVRDGTQPAPRGSRGDRRDPADPE